jgi:hypothetical protein
MAIVTLDFGSKMDMLNKQELAEALAEDARLRAVVAGVKPTEIFIGPGIIGTPATIFSTTGTPPQAPTNGYIWAVMAIGCDLSTGASLTVYKGTPAAVQLGAKLVARGGSANAQAFNFSKGQLWLRPGDQLTFIPGAGNLLSVYLNAIEVPAERAGELLI